MMINWSQPMPRRRSARAGVMPSGAARASSTTKSLPQPCIFTKLAIMVPYMGRRRAVEGQASLGQGSGRCMA
jgi:hypothetical protein